MRTIAHAHCLEPILARADVWRGDRLATASRPGITSGFAALDAELPGGGWPRGALIELMPRCAGLGGQALLLPALRLLARERPLALVGPPWVPHAPAWAHALPGARLWVVQAQGLDAAWSIERLLDAGAAAVLAWLPALGAQETRIVRRLQVACDGRPGVSWLFRSAGAAQQASPAPLRLELAPGHAPGALAVRILKRRGPPCTHTLHLSVPYPGVVPSASAPESPSRQRRLAALPLPLPVLTSASVPLSCGEWRGVGQVSDALGDEAHDLGAEPDTSTRRTREKPCHVDVAHALAGPARA